MKAQSTNTENDLTINFNILNWANPEKLELIKKTWHPL